LILLAFSFVILSLVYGLNRNWKGAGMGTGLQPYGETSKGGASSR